MATFKPIPVDVTGLGYRCVVLDPPWSFQDKGSRAAPDEVVNGAVAKYRTLSTPEIAELPIPDLLAPDAIVLVWAPDTHIPDALWLLDWWGLTYKHLIIWGKVSNPKFEETGEDPRVQMGMGHYLRKAHEVALLATRGHPKIESHSERSLILAPRGRHSQKPEDLQDRAERLISGPYLELFARRRRPSWTCWGDELTQQQE